MYRKTPCLGALCMLVAAQPAHAAASPFDLVGPHLKVSVTHDGVTLPLARVPNLTEGDRISVKLDLPPESDERYWIVAGFLRGAVVRPPKDWFHAAKSWKQGRAKLSFVVPKGAHQVALFIAPDKGANAAAIIGTVRKQPGAFVRGVRGLNQASLDRTRLDTFLRRLKQAERSNPASVATISPILAHSLALKLKSECLQQPAAAQAACLTVDRETLLLADSHSSSLADTLTGTPTDLALQLSTTPQAGYGAYSSYIGVVRDLFRLFGAFQSAQLQFIPALAQMRDGRLTVLINTPLSFGKPTSVMVVALPPVEAPKLPPLHPPEAKLLCAAPGLVLPVEGAPLVYATEYAHAMTLRFALADGTRADIPVHADAALGGFAIDKAFPAGLPRVVAGRLQGEWGFTRFDGPPFALSRPAAGAWQASEASALVAGRANTVLLTGGSVGCVTGVALRRGDGTLRPLSWKQSGTRELVATLPADANVPGPRSLVIDEIGRAAASEVQLNATRKAGGKDTLTIHVAKGEAVLTGTELDQVVGASVGSVRFLPGPITRIGKRERLTLRAVDPAIARGLTEGGATSADIALSGGRHRTVDLMLGSPTAGVTLVGLAARPPIRENQLAITLSTDDVVPQNARVTFAFHSDSPEPLTGRERIEIATDDGRAAAQIEPGKGYDLQDEDTGIVAFTPADALGPMGYGALRFRVTGIAKASSWTPLVTAARLPELRALHCTQKACTLSGRRLFLLQSVDPNPASHHPEAVPDGFVAGRITTRSSRHGRLLLRLRDAPAAEAFVRVR